MALPLASVVTGSSKNESLTPGLKIFTVPVVEAGKFARVTVNGVPAGPEEGVTVSEGVPGTGAAVVVEVGVGAAVVVAVGGGDAAPTD